MLGTSLNVLLLEYMQVRKFKGNVASIDQVWSIGIKTPIRNKERDGKILGMKVPSFQSLWIPLSSTWKKMLDWPLACCPKGTATWHVDRRCSSPRLRMEEPRSWPQFALDILGHWWKYQKWFFFKGLRFNVSLLRPQVFWVKILLWTASII